MTPRSLGKRHCRTISRDDLDFPVHGHSAVEDAAPLHVRRYAPHASSVHPPRPSPFPRSLSRSETFCRFSFARRVISVA